MSAIPVIAYTLLGRTLQSTHPVWVSLIYVRVALSFLVYVFIYHFFLSRRMSKLTLLLTIVWNIVMYLSLFLLIDGVTYMISEGVDLAIFMFKGGVKFFLFHLATLALSFFILVQMHRVLLRGKE
jgi:hypothetical protein